MSTPDTTDGCMWCRYGDSPVGPNCPIHAGRPYSTAPKDGRLIGLWADDAGGPFPMRWDADAVNPLVGDVRGLWVLADGSMTWSDHDPAYAPTHWVEIVQ